MLIHVEIDLEWIYAPHGKFHKSLKINGLRSVYLIIWMKKRKAFTEILTLFYQPCEIGYIQ